MKNNTWKKTNNSKFPPVRIQIKLIGSDGRTHQFHSTKTKRIFSIIKAEDFLKALLKVDYGIDKDVFGKSVRFSNQGIYFSKKDLIQALKTFTERSYRGKEVNLCQNLKPRIYTRQLIYMPAE